MTTQAAADRTGVGSEAAPEWAAPLGALVDAFGMGWGAFTLYERPEENPAFVRSVATLGRCPGYPWRVEVGPEGFVADGAGVPSRLEATARLARRIFGLGVAALEVSRPPAATDLLALYRMASSAEAPRDPGAVLRSLGARSITVLHRDISGAGEDRLVGAPRAAAADGDPEAFAHTLLAGHPEDPAGAAAAFLAEYRRVRGLLDADDPWSREEVVHAFIDAFWCLPSRQRRAVFAAMLEERDVPEITLLLDQFGTTELAEIHRSLGSAHHPLLEEYVRVAAIQGGRQSGDVAAIFDGGPAPGREVIDRIAEVLRSMDQEGSPAVEAALRRLRSRLPGTAEERTSAGNVVRGIVDLGAREGRLEQAAAIWASLVAASLRDGDLDGADRWLEAVEGLDLDDSGRAVLFGSLARTADRGCAAALVEAIGSEGEAPGAAVRRAAPRFATDALVADLGAETQLSRRKVLIGTLTALAACDPGPLIPHLEDPRWFVVRNVVLVLGSAGAPASAVAPALRHDDHRVRVEALTALQRLEPEAAVAYHLEALEDPHDGVAGRAGSLLARAGDPAVDDHLIRRLRSSADRTTRLRIISLLGRRPSREARGALEEIAGRRFAWWGVGRTLKLAAREALRGA